MYDYKDAVREITDRLIDGTNHDLMMALDGNFYRVFLEGEAVEIYEVRDDKELKQKKYFAIFMKKSCFCKIKVVSLRFKLK